MLSKDFIIKKSIICTGILLLICNFTSIKNAVADVDHAKDMLKQQVQVADEHHKPSGGSAHPPSHAHHAAPHTAPHTAPQHNQPHYHSQPHHQKPMGSPHHQKPVGSTHHQKPMGSTHHQKPVGSTYHPHGNKGVTTTTTTKPHPQTLHGKQPTTTTTKQLPHHGQQPTTLGTTNQTKHLNNFKQIQPKNINRYTRPSHLSNTFTQTNLHHAGNLNSTFVHSPGNTAWVHNVNGYQNYYHQNYYQANVYAYNIYNPYYSNNYYRYWYSPWYAYGFFGGFWYPVRPVFLIQDYFYYPTVQWFYVEEPVPVTYYRAYYPSEPVPPRSCLGAFPYRYIYFPTDTFRDLLVEVSAFPQRLRCAFRQAVINMTKQLQQDVQINFFAAAFSFGKNNIVINYYQNLQNRAIVVAGFVDQNKIRMAFEGFLDLENPAQTLVVAPKGQTPTQEELQNLNNLNDRIKALGGDPFTAQQEPTAPVKEPEVQAGP